MRIDRTEEQRKRRAGNFDPALLKHGKASTYTNYSCRCDECREAATRWSREWRQKNPEKAAARRRKAEQWKRNNPERAKEYQVRGGFKKYGLTESNYLEMLKKQGEPARYATKSKRGPRGWRWITVTRRVS